MILAVLPFYASTFLDSFKVGARYIQISGPNGSALSSSQYISYSQNS
jgi:hypothetical protein